MHSDSKIRLCAAIAGVVVAGLALLYLPDGWMLLIYVPALAITFRAAQVEGRFQDGTYPPTTATEQSKREASRGEAPGSSVQGRR